MTVRCRGTRVAAVAMVILGCAGCGGPIRSDELKRGVQSLESTAAEGRLLAREAARGRLRDPFTRAHARDLGAAATHEAEKLDDAPAEGDTAAVKTDATKLAQDIADALGELQVSPDDAAVARETGRKLGTSVRQAGDLAQKL